MVKRGFTDSKVTGVILNRGNARLGAASRALRNLEHDAAVIILYAGNTRAARAFFTQFAREISGECVLIIMSPLVKRRRARPGDPEDQHIGMLAFESLSAGVLALAVGFATALVAVGVFVLIVWPLTSWDLLISAETYNSWAKTVLWSLFAGGSLAGYWCFSGAAFSGRRNGGRSNGRRQTQGAKNQGLQRKTQGSVRSSESKRGTDTRTREQMSTTMRS
jgi:hypothetical protein